MKFNAKVDALISNTYHRLIEPEVAAALTLVIVVMEFFNFIKSAISLAADELENSGPDKKEVVVDAVSRLWDVVAPLIPCRFPIVFSLLLYPLIIKPIVMAIASGAIEWLYRQQKAGLLKPGEVDTMQS